MTLQGERFVIERGDERFPHDLLATTDPPKALYIMGSLDALVPGLAVVGARKATPYGRSCARRFAGIAARKGICIISGGARGCDSEAHRAALGACSPTVVFIGGGLDNYYPAAHGSLFQEVIDRGGALVSEYPWDTPALPYMFRARNRLIAGLAHAVLIVEAGLPSGTFSTADEALSMGKEVLVVPGSIASPLSRGSNRLLYQGATPVVDDETFEDVLFNTFCALRTEEFGQVETYDGGPLYQALLAQPLSMEELYDLARSLYDASVARARMNEVIAEAESRKLIARQADGRWAPLVS